MVNFNKKSKFINILLTVGRYNVMLNLFSSFFYFLSVSLNAAQFSI